MRALTFVVGLVGLLIVVSSRWWLWSALELKPLLLAPMMDLNICLMVPASAKVDELPDWQKPCAGPNGSAAPLVESTLRFLQAKPMDTAELQLGYTLHVPLLHLIDPFGKPGAVQQQAIDNVARTIQDNPRPLILYLFSTHFSIDASIERELAKDPDNFAYSSQGPLPVDSYYSQPLYPWTVARTDNSITRARETAIRALADKLCEMPSEARHRIKGITLLGEVHQHFPNFQGGMGFQGDYQVTDYSPQSVAGFRRFLQSRYREVSKLNLFLDSDYGSFDEVDPPSKNIRKDALTRFQDHVDSYAAGTIPVTGWLHSPHSDQEKQSVRVFLNGKAIADAPVHLGRQDVRVAHPEFNTADLGWRYDLDYRRLPTGIHQIDLALVRPGQPLVNLGTRTLSIMDRRQLTPLPVPMVPLPAMALPSADTLFYVDEPKEQQSYFYNALAQDWNEFREQQVLHYIEYFNNVVAETCLADIPRYTHQIVPQYNPGWDGGKYAVGASLKPHANIASGVSLYGETSYGDSFLNWIRKDGRRSYGITEFHPLTAMSAQQLGAVFNRHHQNGATFLSFFVETRWKGQRLFPTGNLFAFDPDNPEHASDTLFSSVQTLLAPKRAPE